MHQDPKIISSVFKGLSRRAAGWKHEEHEAWFRGFIIGDGSYTCRYNSSVFGVETSHLGTLLAFMTIGYYLSDEGYIRVISYPRKDPRSFAIWKARVTTYSRSEHSYMCSHASTEILKEYINDPRLLSAFTAGYIDSDGSIVLSVKRRFRPKPYYYLEPEIIIVDTNKELLEDLRNAWIRYGVGGSVQRRTDVLGLFRYRLSSKGAIFRFLDFILNYMLNVERVGKASLLYSILNRKNNVEPYRLKRVIGRHKKLLDTLQRKFIGILQQLYRKDECLIINEGGIKTVRKRSVTNPL